MNNIKQLELEYNKVIALLCEPNLSVFSTEWDRLLSRKRELNIKLTHELNPVYTEKTAIQTKSIQLNHGTTQSH